MGIKVHWLNCTKNCAQECREDTLCKWLSADEILYGATSGGIPGSKNHPEARTAELLRRDGTKSLSNPRELDISLVQCGPILFLEINQHGQGSFPPQHWLPCLVETWNWTGLKGWFITKALVEELICVLEMPPEAEKAAVGGLNGRGFGDGKYKLPIIRRSIKLFPCWLDT